MRFFISAISAILAVGCASSAADLPSDAGTPGPLVKLEINVVVGTSGVVVSMRESERSCRCTLGEWPANGDCFWQADFASCNCNPYPASCVKRIALEREGPPAIEGVISLPLPTGIWLADETLANTNLVIEGCGGRASVPLNPLELPKPSVSYTSIQESLNLRWESSAETSLARVNIGDGEWSVGYCHDSTGAISIPIDPTHDWRGSVQSYGSPTVHETEIGTITLWPASPSQRFTVKAPVAL